MKRIEIIAESKYQRAIQSAAEQQEVLDCWIGPQGQDGRRAVHLVVKAEKSQAMLDSLQAILGTEDQSRILMHPLEAVLPRPEPKPEEKKEEEKKESSVATTREELYHSVEKNARTDTTYLLLVFLSTIVVAIGLLEDNVAVVIGAMVIAPLLGPNIALALATALGDTPLIWKSLKTSGAGLGLALGVTTVIGMFWPVNVDSRELLARTDVGVDSMVLALASGAAAVLSLTTGLPSVLVGVMVAVALLPPAATFGLMLGGGRMDQAVGAGLLLAVNVVAVNLAAKLAFLVQGIKPRTWLEKQKARQSMTAYILFWIISLLILMVAIFLREEIPTAS